MALLYMGLPFSHWQDEPFWRAEDKRLTRAFAQCGQPVSALNSGVAGHAICEEAGWDDAFVATGPALPERDFLSDAVYWEDFLFLYISASAAMGPEDYSQFVTEAARQAADNGLFVVADQRRQARNKEWQAYAHLTWSEEERPLPRQGNCRLSLAVHAGQVQIAGPSFSAYPSDRDSISFMPPFLCALLTGNTLADAVRAGAHESE